MKLDVPATLLEAVGVDVAAGLHVVSVEYSVRVGLVGVAGEPATVEDQVGVVSVGGAACDDRGAVVHDPLRVGQRVGKVRRPYRTPAVADTDGTVRIRRFKGRCQART